MIKTIGRFEIVRELGRGSQSVVYLARDPQLQRDVAIKTLHFASADARVNAALLAEARTVSQLHHANVVPIYDAGEQDGDVYLVFEYVSGGTLQDALKKQHHLAPARAADLMMQVTAALAEAHAIGIIHRDLKPSNILLDAAGVPKVMDFGIAVRPGFDLDQSPGLVGTPAYMAPEYIESGLVSERMDVFAAGLMLLELLTGQRHYSGGSAEAVIRLIVAKPVGLPADTEIDEALGNLILRACAHDPERRFSSATEMRQALEAYLDGIAQAGSAPASEAGQQTTLEFLLRRMRHRSDFPALSDSVSAINKLTHSDRESINKLSNSILRDYALTNKILRLVNSAYYRQAGGGSISTVSRAVMVLGFDAIRNIAITVLLFEHLQDKGNARELKESFLRANLAGLLARQTSSTVLPREGEEAYICAMFHGLGQLLAQFYFPEEVTAVHNLMQSKGLDEQTASARVLGLSFEDLGVGIARNWGFPASIIHAMRGYADGPIRRPGNREDSLRLMAVFSNALCDTIADTPIEDRDKAIHKLARQFAAGTQMDARQVEKVVEMSSVALAEVAAILHVNLKQSPFARQVQAFAPASVVETGGHDVPDEVDTTLAATILAHAQPEEPDNETETGGDADIGATVSEDAQSILLAGIQDISDSLVDSFQLNDVLRITLETMYRAMGFRRVLLCLRDAPSDRMTGRFGFGADTNDIARRFAFPLAYSPDVFHLATSKAADIIIADIDDPKIADRIPEWYRKLLAARTFVLFPLNVKGKPVAMIYCDKDQAGTILIPEKELTLLKTLRNQAVLAIKQSIP